MNSDQHLDLGCGGVPRNPYGRAELFGVDLVVAQAASDPAASRPAGPTLRAANLAVQPIPFPDNSFDSVSAYDFFEHVPRVLPTADGLGTRLPFVELMDQIWRVLKPGGVLYAVTPVVPHLAVFQDPTHVNFITTGTHEYFVGPQPRARMYGFKGQFEARRVQLTRHHEASVYAPAPQGFWQRLRQRQRERRSACGHLIWEFEAVKPGSSATRALAAQPVTA